MKTISEPLDIAMERLIRDMMVEHIPIDTDIRTDLDGPIYRSQVRVTTTTSITAIKELSL